MTARPSRRSTVTLRLSVISSLPSSQLAHHHGRPAGAGGYLDFVHEAADDLEPPAALALSGQLLLDPGLPHLVGVEADAGVAHGDAQLLRIRLTQHLERHEDLLVCGVAVLEGVDAGLD